MTIAAGTQLGRCRILRQIGAGGMGEVYLAEQPELSRHVAVKVLRTKTDGTDSEISASVLRDFEREARSIAALEHPHVVPVYEYGEHAGMPYLVMPYVATGSLSAMIAGHSSVTVQLPLAPPVALRLVRQTAEALAYAHGRGIIHRDVKPGNMLVRVFESDLPEASVSVRAGPDWKPHVLLADFGLARVVSELAERTGVAGTPQYTPPEQLRGHPSPASDQYALACVAFLLLTGTHVFTGPVDDLERQHFAVPPPPASRRIATLPAAADAPLLRALEKQQEQRFPSVLAFVDALEAAFAPALTVDADGAERSVVRLALAPVPVAVPAATRKEESSAIAPRILRTPGGGAPPPLPCDLPTEPATPTGPRSHSAAQLAMRVAPARGTRQRDAVSDTAARLGVPPALWLAAAIALASGLLVVLVIVLLQFIPH